MINKDKCLDCVSVKTACFVLAIINAIANGFILIWFSFGALGVLIAALISGGDGSSTKIGGVSKRSIEENDSFKEIYIRFMDHVIFNYWIPFQYLMIICGLFSLISFIFSVLLCYGINNGRWRLVKAYFIYGCVITGLAILASIIQFCIGHSAQLGLWGLFGCALHSLFLVLVYQTHKKLLEDVMISDFTRLVDNEDIRDFI